MNANAKPFDFNRAVETDVRTMIAAGAAKAQSLADATLSERRMLLSHMSADAFLLATSDASSHWDSFGHEGPSDAYNDPSDAVSAITQDSECLRGIEALTEVYIVGVIRQLARMTDAGAGINFAPKARALLDFVRSEIRYLDDRMIDAKAAE